MRFDPFYLNSAVASLDQTSALEQHLTSEISSGSRVNSLSDDPVAAGENVLLSSQLNLDDSFSQTESSTVGMLQVTDSTLGSVISQLTKALSLATEGNNGTLNASDLQSISTELSGIRDEVLSLANTTYMNQYLFSGSQGSTTPYTLNSAVTPSTVTYNGDAVTSYVTTPNGQKIQTNLPGSQIFSDPTNNVLQTLNNLVADFSTGTASAGSIADTTSLNSALNYVSQQRVVMDNSITQLQAAQTYTQAQGTQITSAQTNLMQADVAQVSTQLSTAETQQAALTQVVNILEKNNGGLFSLL
ncbi:flagellar hook-associated protein 3 [Alloacidobacterium dinghuense]|uniref:Flagellar hook-associated protein 3 n=1 Tax=Alloacidobacterium dinghuense TaxID=2763107 RepID=A0A7G8BNL9_9BACT|nr:flagellar hook-associated protein 3 [Alloacidobacterium dinghuense]QNI34139.1 flagellar hook-associated protein 3 [Alloacidobacterium dinghuense]